MKAIGRRLEMAERKADPPAGVIVRLLEDAGPGQYRDRATGALYSEAELADLAGILILRERIVGGGRDDQSYV